MKAKLILVFCVLWILGASAAWGQTEKYAIFNHGILFFPKAVTCDKAFASMMDKNLVGLNKNLHQKLTTSLSSKWKIYEDNWDPTYLENIVNMAILISRGDVSEEQIHVSRKIGEVSYNTFNVAASLVFFKMTNQSDATGLEVYYNRFITGAKVVKLDAHLGNSQKEQYFLDNFKETLAKALEKAFSEYNPEVLEGKVIEKINDEITINLGYLHGLRKNNFLTAHLPNNEIIDLEIKSIQEKKCIATAFMADDDTIKKINSGTKITSYINAKRISNSVQTFRVNNFKIKDEAAQFFGFENNLKQILHDYLTETRKINIVPSGLAAGESTLATLKTYLNIPGSISFHEPQSDYIINVVLQKTAKSTLDKSDIAKNVSYAAYAAAGVRPDSGPDTELVLVVKAGEGVAKKMISGQTEPDSVFFLDAVQATLRTLARDLAAAVPQKITLNFAD